MKRDLSNTDFDGLIAVHREQCRLRAGEPRDERVSDFEQLEEASGEPLGWLKVAFWFLVPIAAAALGLYLA